MHTRFNNVVAKSAGRATVAAAPEAAARPSCQPQRPQAQAAPDQPPSQVSPAPRKRFRWTIALTGVLVLLAGTLVANRISLYRPQVAVSYNSRLAELDAKLSRALASHLRAAGYEFDAAIVSVEGPACQRAVCLVKRLRRGELTGLWGRVAGRHSRNGWWSFAGTGELANLKFNVEAAAEMQHLAESTPPEFLQVPVAAAPIESPGRAAPPSNRAFELWLSARTDGRQAQWLDLETGRCLMEPEWEYFIEPSSYSGWLGSNRLDLFAAVPPDGFCWLFTRHMAVVPVEARLWDQAPPEEIISHPALRSAPLRIRGSLSPTVDHTDTYLFRTEAGTIGVLRVVELNCSSQELRIRYKLLTPAANGDV